MKHETNTPGDLFSEKPPHAVKTRGKTLSIAAGHQQPHLSKTQKAFNTLIEKIEKKRARFAAWEAAIPLFQKQFSSELMPLFEELLDAKTRMVHCLDRASSQKGLTKTERRMIANLIAEWAAEVAAERDDAEMKAIYNKYSRSDYDSEEAASMQGMKSVLEDMLGIDLGDDVDMSSPDDILKHAQAQLQERHKKYDTERQAREERLAQRKKSAKQLAREARQEADEQQLRQSIREIYRKLASSLHPDRETDPNERERKTLLMQRVNQAYDKNNLLQLLELQLELEHIDQTSINNISEQRLKHYNKILREQLEELEHEILAIEDAFRMQLGLMPFEGVSPTTIMRNLAAEIVDTQRAIRVINKDLLTVEDSKKVKTWIKAFWHRRRMMDDDDLPF